MMSSVSELSVNLSEQELLTLLLPCSPRARIRRETWSSAQLQRASAHSPRQTTSLTEVMLSVNLLVEVQLATSCY